MVNGEFRNPVSFDQWLASVDRTMSRRYGMTSSDVEDWPWISDYRDDRTPTEAVDEWAVEYFEID